MHANSSRRAHAGFTLIEVLAALVIVSLGMLGVIEAVSQTASNGSYMRDKTIAHWVAMNRLATVRLEQRSPKVDKTSDEIEMAGRRWRWTMEVTQTQVETLRRIDIRVAPADADEESSLASVTGFYGSAIAAAGTGTSVWVGAQVPGAPNGDQPNPDGTPDPNNTPPPAETPSEGDPAPEPVDPPPDDRVEPAQ